MIWIAWFWQDTDQEEEDASDLAGSSIRRLPSGRSPDPFQFTSLSFRISGPQSFRWPISQHSILTRAKCGECHEQIWSEAVANETFQENFLAQDQHYFGSLSPDIRSLHDWLVRPFFFDCDMLTALSLSGTWQSRHCLVWIRSRRSLLLFELKH